jgi:hypothetical protein
VQGNVIRADLQKCLVHRCRFTATIESNNHDRRTYGRPYAERAHDLFNPRDISVSAIQACILLGTLCFTEGETRQESIYYASANRMAMILDLPNCSTATELERQINLRGKVILLHQDHHAEQ